MYNRNATSAACVFLLILLLLIPVSPNCRKGTADECSKAKLVPGFEFAGMGINIQTLKMTTLYKEISKPGECTLCENPLLKGKPLQRLPLVITDWKANITCNHNVQSLQFNSPISVAEALTELKVKNGWSWKEDDNIQLAHGGSRSTLTQECIRRSSQDKYTFLLHHISCSYYKFSVKKSMLFSGYFLESINLLPEKFNRDSKGEYFHFISTFGTHWVKEFDLGAQVRHLTYFSMCEAVLENLNLNELFQCVSLDVGIPFGLPKSTDGFSLQECKERMKKYNLQSIGSRMETEGGLYFSREKEWLECAKSWPGSTSFFLKSLYTLVDSADPRRESLWQAQSEYVRENALRKNCTKPCPPGSKLDDHEFCSCQCPNNNFTNSMCCAPKRGLGKLVVTIEHGESLRGDYITGTDGYVSVTFNGRKMCTDTVWNNNNPTWNAVFDFGVNELSKNNTNLKVEVWDEDYGWDDDLLGRCNLPLNTGISESLTCYLQRGMMHLKYHLLCGYNLHGSTCWDYYNHWSFTET